MDLPGVCASCPPSTLVGTVGEAGRLGRPPRDGLHRRPGLCGGWFGACGVCSGVVVTVPRPSLLGGGRSGAFSGRSDVSPGARDWSLMSAPAVPSTRNFPSGGNSAAGSGAPAPGGSVRVWPLSPPPAILEV